MQQLAYGAEVNIDPELEAAGEAWVQEIAELRADPPPPLRLRPIAAANHRVTLRPRNNTILELCLQESSDISDCAVFGVIHGTAGMVTTFKRRCFANCVSILLLKHERDYIGDKLVPSPVVVVS